LAQQANRKRAAVIGWPVSHSLSPRLHGYWLKEYGIAGSYEALEVTPDHLTLMLRTLHENDFTGINITVPHKEKALAAMDEIDPVAKRIGAVNTVIVQNEKNIGMNTDAYGFIANIKAEMKGAPVGKALILGAGGAARAAAVGLLDEGWKVIISNRTYRKAVALEEHLHDRNIKVIPCEKVEDAMGDVSLLVNTTILGMKGQPQLELSLDALSREAFVNDIVYVPAPSGATARYDDPTFTDLLARARDRGNPVITGLGMLLYQAQPAFEAWFGVKPEVTERLLQHMQEAL